MNKRGPTGLPTKPYMQNTGPGPAPPLPSGPPPVQMQQQQQYQQQQQGQVVDQAAHAAAWAAYYQAQGINPAASYSASPQPAPVVAAPGTAANPYANYGYGAGATHGTAYQPPGSGQQGAAGPSQPFRPAPNTQAYATATTQPSLGYGGQQQPQYGQQPQAVYSPNPVAAGYSTPQPQPPVHGQGRPPYQQQQQGGYGWGGPQQNAPVAAGGQGYRPPPPQQPQQQVGAAYPQQAGPFYPQAQQIQQQQMPPQASTQQPFVGGGNQPYRPPAQHSPYRPPGVGGGGVNQHRPARPPPIATPLHFGTGGHPPAKRPRFDGPGSGGMNNNVRPPNGPMQNSINRPPSAPAAFTSGVNGGQPGFNSSSASASTSSSRGGLSNSIGRGGAPIPSSRPPIHLGGGGPPPFGIGIGGRGGAPLRGGLSARGGRGGSSVGVVGAPRGPSGMIRRDNNSSNRGSLPPPPAKKELPKKEKRKEELKITMTDFRIIGIEVKGLDWSWGKTGGSAEVEEQEIQEEENKQEAEKVDDELPVSEKVKDEVIATATAAPELDVKVEEIEKPEDKEEVAEIPKEENATEEVKVEQSEAIEDVSTVEAAAEAVEEKEKRGEKRKAKSPDSEEEESSAKKRNSSYILTHNKPNNTISSTNNETSIFESNQNRFRIYFDSPPELDRIPKSARRKRGRESSSVAPSRTGEAGEVEVEVEGQNEPESAAAVGETTSTAPAQAEEVEVVKEEAVESARTTGVTEQSVQETTEQVGAEQVSLESTGEAEIPVIQQAVIEVPESEATSAEANDVTAVEPNEVEDQVVEVPAEPSEIPNQGAAAAEPVEEVGDISMVSEPGLLSSTDEDTTAIPSTNDAQVETTDNSAEQNPTEITSNTAEIAPNGEQEQVDTLQDPTSDTAVPAGDTSDVIPAAPQTRSRRHSSVSSVNEQDQQSILAGDQPVPSDASATPVKSVPSTNRLSILYEKSSRRICIDSDVVEKVRIWRKEGRIEVEFKDLKGDKKEGEQGNGVDLPKGILVESYDSTDQRFISLNSTNVSTFYPEPEHKIPNEEGKSIPPFHQFAALPSPIAKAENDNSSSGGLTLTVYLNKKNPLSEPKWCRNNSADNWLYEQFGSRKIEKDEKELADLGLGSAGWKSKLEVMDPDPAPTLKSILESWLSSSVSSKEKDEEKKKKKEFIQSLLDSPLDTLEILLRLTRGDRNPIYSSSSSSTSPSNSTGSGSGSTFDQSYGSIINKNSPYLNYQTHVSLAVLAMYKLSTNLIDKYTSIDEKKKEEELKTLNDNINDIITNLPINMILRSLDGLWKEYNSYHKDNVSSKSAPSISTAPNGNGK